MNQEDRAEGGITKGELEQEIRRLSKENKSLEIERRIEKNCGLLCQRAGLRYDFIRQQKEAFPITILCTVMEVRRSCFYFYLKRRRTQGKDPCTVMLGDCIKTIFAQTKENFGSRKIAKKLQSEGYHIGRYQARSFMRKRGLQLKKSRCYKVTTDSHHSYPVAPHLLERQFETDIPNTVWTADITYIWTLDGWVYLAVVMDLFNRQIAGFAIDKRMKS